MTLTPEQIEGLKRKALAATPGEWAAFIDMRSGTFAVHTPDDQRKGNIVGWTGFDGDARSSKKQAAANARHIAAANPATILSLIALAERALLPDTDAKTKAAMHTLESKGYTWNGGEQWKPPLGKPPASVLPPQPQEGQALPADRLKLILSGDPAWLLAHVKENSVFDADLLADVFKLAKERTSQLALPAGPVPEGDDLRAKYRTKSAECDQLFLAIKGESSPAVARPVADERVPFEVWARVECNMPAHVPVNWDATWVKQAWEGWRARAALCQSAEEVHPGGHERGAPP